METITEWVKHLVKSKTVITTQALYGAYIVTTGGELSYQSFCRVLRQSDFRAGRAQGARGPRGYFVAWKAPEPALVPAPPPAPAAPPRKRGRPPKVHPVTEPSDPRLAALRASTKAEAPKWLNDWRAGMDLSRSGKNNNNSAERKAAPTPVASVNHTSIKITESVPIPDASPLSVSVYPFCAMKVGASFSVPLRDSKSVRSAAHSYGKRHGIAFTCRVMPDNSVRCWRIK